MKLKKFQKNNKRNTTLIIAVVTLVGLVVSTNLIKSHANFNTSKSFNIIQGKIPNKNNGDVTLAVKLDGVSYKEKDENGNKIFPPIKGYRYTQSDCTNGASASVEKNETNNTWDVTVKTSKPAVCTINFETYTSRNLIEVLKETNELVTFTHEDTVQTGSNTNTDYRYTGSDPNNYVKFNDELWRIIGVFNTDDGTGKWEERVKLVRATGIGSFAWSENNSNDWSMSTLKILLNEGAYYDRSGEYSTIGLTQKSKFQISKVKWYLGGTPKNYSSLSDGLTKHFFGYERGTAVYTERPINWTGNIGLIYLSDYGFASDLKSNCTSNYYLSQWDNYQECVTNNWIYNGNFNNKNTEAPAEVSGWMWSLNHRNDVWSRAFMITSMGNVDSSNYDVNYTGIGVRPVVFLKNKIQTTSGNGTKDNPYELLSE